MARQHNFSAGPATLPQSVLEELQQAILEFGDAGAGIMELSHRGAAFSEVIEQAEQRLRSLLSIPKDYAVLFLQGGASMQFYMSALNLNGPGEAADYLVTGTWSQKAVKEAKRVSDAKAIWDGAECQFRSLPSADNFSVREEANYVHYTTNNTIYGTQWAALPDTGDTPLVADMSSDICCRPVDLTRHGVLYAGAQKNLGPSGVTVVILSPWALEQSQKSSQARPGGLPSMLDYALMADKQSMFNTPNTWGIYALERTLAWIESQGALASMEAANQANAQSLYAELDPSECWPPHADTNVRSLMNVTWRSPSAELDTQFIKQAGESGLHALKGHRSIGGIRASIYNACPAESVNALVEFMRDFEAKQG